MIIDGKEIAKEILARLKEKRKSYDKLKVTAFMIGRDEEKLSFLKIKKKIASELEIDFRIYEIKDEPSLTRKKIRRYISQIVRNKTVNGALIQLPLPSRFPTQYLLNTIPPQKDIDCLTSRLLGKFFSNSPVIYPPAVEVIREFEQRFNLDFEGKLVLILGYGRLIGKPISHYLLSKGAGVIVLQEKNNLQDFILKADVIISGVGQKNLVSDCKEGAIVIDFGYTIQDGKIYGDVNFEKLKEKASLITPTPGGTGPILVVKLFENLFKLMEYSLPF